MEAEITQSHKRCRCKLSKCLKLYCVCFSSGGYCNEGCDCDDCHNNFENETVRAKAVENVLERKPDAFSPKIGRPPDKGVENNATRSVTIHNRGCCCKRSECLMRYCECFQANIFCNRNCKCLSCKNVEGLKERLYVYRWDDRKVVSLGDFRSRNRVTNRREDVMDSLEDINTAISSDISLSGASFYQEAKKQKLQKLDCRLNRKEQLVHKWTDHQVHSVSLPTPISAHPAGQLNPAALGLYETPYSPLSADVFRRADRKQVCSGLITLAEAAKLLAAGTADKQKSDVNEETFVSQGAKTLPHARDRIQLHKIDTSVNTATCVDHLRSDKDNSSYAEQERQVLVHFRDCLQNLIHGRRAEAELSHIIANGANRIQYQIGHPPTRLTDTKLDE